MIRNAFVGAVFVWSLAVGASADVPPEIPNVRTAQIFSPASFDLPDMGRSVFMSGGVYMQGYDSSDRCIVDRWPSSLTSVPNCGVRELISMLGKSAGILHLETHSSNDLGGNVFMVEIYRADVNNSIPCQFAEQRRQSYIAAGLIQDDELETFKDGSHCVLRAHPIFVTRRLTAPHGIVHGMFCESSQQAPAWMGQNKVRNYVSQDDPVERSNTMFGYIFTNGLYRTRELFENMSGNRGGPAGSYGNKTIAAAVSAANAREAVGNPIRLTSINPAAAQMRLYNAPRLVFAKVKADPDNSDSFSHEVYSFVFGNDEYPYNPGAGAN